MPLTAARILDGVDVWSTHSVEIRRFTGDSSYPTGGYSLTGTNFGFGLKQLTGVVVLGGNAGAAPYRPFWDYINKKLIIGSSLGSEIETYTQGDIKGSKTTDVGIASGALQTNGQLLVTLADAANTTTMTIALQPDVPRNVGIAFKNTNVGASTGNAISCVITGTFRGAAQTETISFTALELTSTAQNEVATKYGVKPFDTITSITKPTAQPSGWQAAAGPGSKLGLPQPVSPNVEASIQKITKNAADLAVTGLYGTAGTINFGTLADGDDIEVQYLTGGEVTNATSLTGATWILMGICRGS